MRVALARLRLGVFVLVAAAAALPAAAEEPGWQVGPGARLARPGSDVELRLTGYVQGDFRSFRDYENERGETPELASDSQLRRLRVGFEAKWKRVSFELDVDPHDDTEHLKNAIVDLKISKKLHVVGGNMKLPVSPEWLTSAAKTDFIERNLPADALAPGRDWGAKITGDLGRVTYQLGVFAGDDRTGEARADTTLAGRLEVTLLKGLEAGLSGSQGQVHADPADVESPLARGLSFHAPSGFRLYERHFVDGTRRRLGGDLRFYRGPVGLKAEYLRVVSERSGQGSVFDDLPREVAQGWSASATWLLTGDRKVRTIKPEHAVNHHGVGAVEIGVRYDSIQVDDDGPGEGFEGAGARARNIRPVGGDTFTAGASWWPVGFVRLYGNAVWERFDDALLAPVPGKKGSYVTLLGRLQISVP